MQDLTKGLMTVIFVWSSLGTASADTLDCSSTKVSKEFLEHHAIKPGDVADREMAQFIRVDILSSDNPEFDGIEETVYEHDDNVGGTGTHRGYAKLALKSGATLWVKYEGTHHIVVENDKWRFPYMGRFRFIAGTGKYKTIHGGGWYEGQVTADGLTQKTVCSAEY